MKMNFVSLCLFAFLVVLINLASCKKVYLQPDTTQRIVSQIAAPTYAQRTSGYSQHYGNGQQTTYVERTVQIPSVARTVITKTFNQPMMNQPIIYQETGYRAVGTAFSGGYGRKKRNAHDISLNYPADTSSQPGGLSDKKKRHIPKKNLAKNEYTKFI